MSACGRWARGKCLQAGSRSTSVTWLGPTTGHSSPVFGVGFSGARFDASRSRLDVTSARRVGVRKIEIYIYIYIEIYIYIYIYIFLYKICQKYVKNMAKICQMYPKLSIYIYICMDVYGFCGHRPGSSLVSSRRDLDASKRSRDAPTPKNRMLGLTPSIFLQVDVSRKRRNRSLATPKVCLYVWSERKTTNINECNFVERSKKRRESKKTKKKEVDVCL